MIEAPTHALRVTLLRTICIGATFGLAPLGLLGEFEPSSVHVVLLVMSALSGAMAIAKFVVPKLPDAVVRIYLALLAVVIFVTALTAQPFQHLSIFLLLGLTVAVCSFESRPVAIAASWMGMVLGSIAIIVRSPTPVAAVVIFVAITLLCMTSVLGFRRLSSAAIADAMHDPLTGLANRRGMDVGLFAPERHRTTR